MKEEFQMWLEQRNAGWYLLSNSQFQWYLNEWLNKIEDERKEQNEDEKMV